MERLLGDVLLEQSAKALADAKDSASLYREVVAALYALQVELRNLAPAVADALRDLG